jgi:hypothetical protein
MVCWTVNVQLRGQRVKFVFLHFVPVDGGSKKRLSHFVPANSVEPQTVNSKYCFDIKWDIFITVFLLCVIVWIILVFLT